MQHGERERMKDRSRRNSWYVAHPPNPDAALKLFCFPYAGGSASAFRSWHLALPREVEVCGVQLPGRANRLLEPAFTCIPDLLEELAPALLAVADRPFAFFGHSMGAIVAFELSRWLQRHKEVMPKHLFVSGRRAPQIPD